MNWFSAHLGRRRMLMVLLLSVLSAITLLSLDSRYKLATTRIMMVTVLAPVQEIASWIPHMIHLQQENKRLQAVATALALENGTLQEIARENDRLREMLGLRKRVSFQLLPAEVIAKGMDRAMNAVVIDLGEDVGIHHNMPVMTAAGVVGKVVEVGSTYSMVQLLTDRNCRVSAIVERSRVTGIVSWQYSNVCALRYVPLRADVQPGDTVVSSGWGGVFPAGLMVGRVTEVSENKAELIKQVLLKPSVDFNHLEEVFVITGQKYATADIGGVER